MKIDVSIYDNQFNNRQRLFIPGKRVCSGRVNLPLNYCYNIKTKKVERRIFNYLKRNHLICAAVIEKGRHAKRRIFIYLKRNHLISGLFSKKGGM